MTQSQKSRPPLGESGEVGRAEPLAAEPSGPRAEPLAAEPSEARAVGRGHDAIEPRGVGRVRERGRGRGRVRERERDAIARLAIGIAHEIAGPLQWILIAIHALEDRRASLPRETLADLDELADGAQRIERIARALRGGFTVAPGRVQIVDAGELLREAHRLARHALPSSALLLLHAEPGLPEVMADPAGIAAALLRIGLDLGRDGEIEDRPATIGAAVSGDRVRVALDHPAIDRIDRGLVAALLAGSGAELEASEAAGPLVLHLTIAQRSR